jgi:hypothetical protein
MTHKVRAFTLIGGWNFWGVAGSPLYFKISKCLQFHSKEGVKGNKKIRLKIKI